MVVQDARVNFTFIAVVDGGLVLATEQRVNAPNRDAHSLLIVCQG
jgi:hypothetical protein